MSVVFILWLRELKKYLRSRAQIVASLGTPLMYLGVLGFGLGPVFRRAGEGSYLQFVAPGVIGMTVLFTAMFSGIAMLWDRQFGFLKETLVAPVPRVQIMMGRTLGGATVAVLQGLLIFGVTLVAGFRPTSVLAVILAFLIIALIAGVLGFGGIAGARVRRLPVRAACPASVTYRRVINEKSLTGASCSASLSARPV